MYRILFYGGVIFAILFFFISAHLFFAQHVATLIGDLTGWNTKKALRKMQKKKEHRIQNVKPAKLQNKREDEKTELLSNDEKTTLLSENEETTLLSGNEETTLLPDTDETELLMHVEETSLLVSDAEEDATGALTNIEMSEECGSILDGATEGVVRPSDGVKDVEQAAIPAVFEVQEDVTIVHTKETVE